MQTTLSIGRRVHYWPSIEDLTGNQPMYQADSAQAFNADVAYVCMDGSVYLRIDDHSGESHRRACVPMLQTGEMPPSGAYAQHIPFEVTEAARRNTTFISPVQEQPPVDNRFVAPGCELFKE